MTTSLLLDDVCTTEVDSSTHRSVSKHWGRLLVNLIKIINF